MRVVNTTDLHESQGFDPKFLARQFHELSANGKVLYLSFFSKLKTNEKEIEDALFKEIEVEKDSHTLELMRDVIQQWLMSQSAVEANHG